MRCALGVRPGSLTAASGVVTCLPGVRDRCSGPVGLGVAHQAAKVPASPAVHRGYLVDGPKDREHPVSGMAKYGRWTAP